MIVVRDNIIVKFVEKLECIIVRVRVPSCAPVVDIRITQNPSTYAKRVALNDIILHVHSLDFRKLNGRSENAKNEQLI
jgi:hypothetical protein